MTDAAITYTFADGTDAPAAEMNTNFGDLVDFINTHVIQKDGSLSMTAALTLSGAPTSSLHAATKAYVDGTGMGVVGIATTTSAQNGVSSETDLTSLSVTFTPSSATRRIRLSAWVPVQQITSDSTPLLRIKEGATQLLQANLRLTASQTGHLTGFTVITPTAAAHTYKLTLATGAGTVSATQSATAPALLLAEDLGST